MEKIALNFVPLQVQDFKILVYRKPKEAGERLTDKRLRSYDFSSGAPSEWFWVSFVSLEGLVPYECDSKMNIHLSKAYILDCLQKRCIAALLKENDDYLMQFGIIRQVKFILEKHPEGNQCIWLTPEYIQVVNQFGFLIDFKFDRKVEQPFNRQVQQLSLSLDKQGKSNSSIYFDKYNQILEFGKKYYRKVFKGELIDFGSMIQLPAIPLEIKQYLVGNNQIAVSPAIGLNSNGPYESIQEKVVFYFYWNETERNLASELYKALTGELFKNDKFYKGFAETYGVHLDKTANIKGLKAENYPNQQSIAKLAKHLKNQHENERIVIIAFSNRKELAGAEKQKYLNLKYAFSQEEIPVQFIRRDTITNPYGLRFAIGNIALAIFAKLGGKPWRVKPKNENCLVIGIGQAYHRNFDHSIKKYVAYSVLLDTGGIYKSLEVLSAHQKWDDYVKQLKTQLTKILSNEEDNYQKIAIHIPFRMKYKEQRVIQAAVEAVNSKIEIVVMRINAGHQYWGYDRTKKHLTVMTDNYISLSPTRYLLWLDGIGKREQEPSKRYAAPVFIDFGYANKQLEQTDIHNYIQDLFNLSGANWRGLNAKATPVSVYYCKLVADYIKDFKETLNVDDIHNKFKNPWFL